jgi:hypothetical protein
MDNTIIYPQQKEIITIPVPSGLPRPQLSEKCPLDIFPGVRCPYSQGPAGPILLKNVHWTFFRALDAPESAASLPGEGFWMPHLPVKSEITE